MIIFALTNKENKDFEKAFFSTYEARLFYNKLKRSKTLKLRFITCPSANILQEIIR